ncbi:hypothetical protein CEXT_699291 [Caerostris extrusa]|uniref:Uncharacterized protein n=1 Tax=Caerostris extrusa TaxID=172846 RepID=A0AAV4MBJ7_CAEEX|nr:hypothetical protein CEXT_699291 [Caerostris extrusa]
MGGKKSSVLAEKADTDFSLHPIPGSPQCLETVFSDMPWIINHMLIGVSLPLCRKWPKFAITGCSNLRSLKDVVWGIGNLSFEIEQFRDNLASTNRLLLKTFWISTI